MGAVKKVRTNIYLIPVRIPNEETKKVLEEVEKGENVEDTTLERLMSEAKSRVMQICS